MEIDYSSHQIVTIGPMNVMCQYYKEFMYKNEAPGLCCTRGKVKLIPLIPEPLIHWFPEMGQILNIFWLITIIDLTRRQLAPQKYSRKLYANFQDSGSNLNLSSKRFLIDNANSDYKFLQYYLMGNSAKQVDQRCVHNNSVKIKIVEQLQMFFNQL